jgi:hypothetical protein
MLNLMYLFERDDEEGKRVKSVCQRMCGMNGGRYRARVTDYELEQYFLIL